MAEVVKMPKLGLTMTSGRISRWKKQVGDRVKAGEVIVEIETDKISAEVEAPVDGVVLQILAEEGEEKDITVPICIIGEKEEPASGSRLFVTPVARLLAREHGIDCATIKGSGPLGRIVKKDILSAVALGKKANIGKSDIRQTDVPQTLIQPAAGQSAEQQPIIHQPAALQSNVPQPAIQQTPSAALHAPAVQAAMSPQEALLPAGLQQVTKKVPLAGIRKVIARRLAQSKQEIPHTYFKISVEVNNLIEFKNRVSDAVKAKTGKKLSLNDLIIKAAAAVLEEYPDMNASLVNDEIIYYGSVNIGMAVNSEKGLIVPVISNAGRKSLSEICRNTATMIDKAKNGVLNQDDISGGTFTISNLGAYCIDEFTAIINPPESAILAVGRAADAPCVKDGEIVVRSIMKLTLSVDHRIIDGALAAQFLQRLKELLEDPYFLMI